MLVPLTATAGTLQAGKQVLVTRSLQLADEEEREQCIEIPFAILGPNTMATAQKLRKRRREFVCSAYCQPREVSESSRLFSKAEESRRPTELASLPVMNSGVGGVYSSREDTFP